MIMYRNFLGSGAAIDRGNVVRNSLTNVHQRGSTACPQHGFESIAMREQDGDS